MGISGSVKSLSSISIGIDNSRKQGRSNTGEAVNFPGRYRGGGPFAHFTSAVSAPYTDPALVNEKSLMLVGMLVHRARLSVEYKQIFAAITRRVLVGNPLFDQAVIPEIAKAKIEYQRLDRKQRDIPFLNLPLQSIKREAL